MKNKRDIQDEFIELRATYNSYNTIAKNHQLEYLGLH